MTTTTDNELIDQLVYEFTKQGNYILNASLGRQLKKYAPGAAEVCKELKIDPGTYISAQFRYSPIIRGYNTLTPQQLCSKDSKRYAMEFIALRGERDFASEFNSECAMLGTCLENGWPERLCLLNKTFDFSSWFRILMSTEIDDELIKLYGYNAAQILNNDPGLVEYLKTIKSDKGESLDFSRITGFKI